MCDFKSSTIELRCFSGVLESHIQVEGTATVIEWPCVYLSGLHFDACMELWLAEDNFIGYAYGELGINLFLPSEIVNDEIAREIATLWIFLNESNGIINCCLRLICHRRDTWRCLRKKRHHSVIFRPF